MDDPNRRCPSALGVLLPASDHRVPAELLDGIESEARQHGWDLLPTLLRSRHGLEEQLAGRILSGTILVQPDGASVRRFQQSEEHSFPYLAVGRDAQVSGLPWVASQTAEAARAALRLLRSAGHQRAALVDETADDSVPGPDSRMAALAEAAWEEGLAVHRVGPGHHLRWATAYICFCEATAEVLIEQRTLQGHRCPQDYSVLVFGSPKPGDHSHVTGFREPWELLGREAVRRLAQASRGGDLSAAGSVPWTLVPGQSIGPRSSSGVKKLPFAEKNLPFTVLPGGPTLT